MTDSWVVIPRSLLRLTDLEWLFDTYPEEVFELPFGYFSDKPFPTWVGVGQTVTFQDDTFECIEEGPDKLYYSIIIGVRDMMPTYYSSEQNYLAENGTAKESEIIKLYTQRVCVGVKVNCLAKVEDEDPGTDPGTDPITDPSVQPELDLSFDLTYVDDWIVNRTIYIDITGRPGANGTLTLFRPWFNPLVKDILIDESGHFQISIVVYTYAEYRVVVNLDEFVIEKKIWV